MRHVCFRLRSQEGFEQKSPLQVLELYPSHIDYNQALVGYLSMNPDLARQIVNLQLDGGSTVYNYKAPRMSTVQYLGPRQTRNLLRLDIHVDAWT